MKSLNSLLSLVAVSAAIALAPGVSFAKKPEVTLLYEGHVAPVEGKTLLPWSVSDGERTLSTSVVLVKTDDMTMIVDPGIVRKGEWPKIMAKLADMGIQPEDVDYTFIDHHHPDHTAHLGAFPNAAIVDFWSIYKDEVWTDHPDNYEISPGVTVVRTPGHTKEDGSLLVDTDDGVVLITHMWWHTDLTPDKDPVAQDQPALDRNRTELLKKADWILPTHGKLTKNPYKQ